MSQTSKQQEKPSYTFSSKIPNLSGIPDSTGEIKNFNTHIYVPQIKVPGRTGKDKPGEKKIELTLPAKVDYLSFLYIHLSEHSDECRRILCIPGDSGTGEDGGEPYPRDGGHSHPTQGEDGNSVYPAHPPDPGHPTQEPEYPEDIPEPPREGRCKFYPKDPSDPKKGGKWYYPDEKEWIPQSPYDKTPEKEEHTPTTTPTKEQGLNLENDLIVIGKSLMKKLGNVRTLTFQNEKYNEVIVQVIAGYDLNV
jgi:hypothetical protein